MTWTTVLASLAFALAGAMCAGVLVILSPHPNPDLGWLIVTAGAGSFLTALPVWGLIMRAGLEGFWRGLIAGGLIGVLAHPVTWCLLIWFAISTPGGGSAEPMSFFAAPLVSLFLSFWSLLILGWLSFPLAATIGGFMGLIIARLRAEPARETETV